MGQPLCKGRLLPAHCSRCGGNVYEDESFVSEGKLYYELVCLHCARYVFLEKKEYQLWLKRLGK